MRKTRAYPKLPLALLVWFLLTGMSRPLNYKQFQGQVKQPVTGVSVSGKIVGFLKENVNNQGCIGKKTLDTILSVMLTNNTKKSINIDGKQVVLYVDGKKYRTLASQYFIKGKKYTLPHKTFVVAPGKQARLVFNSYAFLPQKVLKTTSTIEVHVPIGKNSLVLTYKGLQKVAVQTGYRRVIMPYGTSPHH